MVQVGCTINYDRTRLWKETAECGSGQFDCVGTASPGCPSSAARLRLAIALTIRTTSARIRKAVRDGQPLVSPHNGPVAQLGARFHGMEEVVGSIPTRSTIPLNKLDGTSAHKVGVCVVVCVITRRFAACGKDF